MNNSQSIRSFGKVDTQTGRRQREFASESTNVILRTTGNEGQRLGMTKIGFALLYVKNNYRKKMSDPAFEIPVVCVCVYVCVYIYMVCV